MQEFFTKIMHLSLYRKYRPRQFDEISGEEHVKNTLKSAVKHEKISHAYLFAGPRGTGKTSTARILAKAIICEQRLPDGNPCSICEPCLAVSEGSFIDVIEIDAASHRGIDEIRSLVETVSFHPTQSKKKVYIIDEVHMLSKDASNALLKTIEEPPAFVHFILATTEAHKILPTIISRCQFFVFSPLAENEIFERLDFVAKEEKREVPQAILETISRESRGGMRDALTSLERILSLEVVNEISALQILGFEESHEYEAMLDDIIQKNISGIEEKIEQFEKSGKNPASIIKNFLSFVHRKFAVSLQKNDKQMLDTYANILEILRETLSELKYADIPYLPLRLGIYRLVSDTSVPTEKPSMLLPEKKLIAKAMPEIRERPVVPSPLKILKEKVKEEVIQTKESEPEPKESSLEDIARLFGGTIQ